MITPQWLTDELGYLVTHKQLQESILRSIVRRLQKTNFIMTDTAAWQAEKLQQAGMLHDEILKEVAKLTKKSDEEIRKIFADAKVEVFNYDDEILKKAGYVPKEFKNLSPAMVKTLNAAFRKTVKEVRNLTRTTAVTSQRCFISACDLAHMQIVSGAFTYQEAIKNAIKSAAKEGTKIVYPSGKTASLDAAVRRAALTGVNQTTGKLMEMRADDMDIDIMEISAHFGARPSHAEWQGQLVSRSGKKGYLTLDDIDYGRVDGFMGANCRHNWFIFFEGISKRNYTKEQLDNLKNETVTYNGEEMPMWKARDKQRAYERNIRSIKEQLVAFDEASKNVLTSEEQLLWKAEINNLSVKLKSGEAALKDFCNQTGLARDRFREQVFATQTENGIKNFGKSVSQKAVQSARRKYKDFLSVVGVDNAPETLDKYYNLKYNKPKEFEELKRFYKFRLDNPNSTKQHFYCVEDIKKHFKCEKVYLPTYDIDVDKLEFDSLHINKQRKHNVTEQQAKTFIRNSPITFEKYNGDSLIYVSEAGASYVLKSKGLIRTSFSKDEFDDTMKNVIEELKKHGYI